MKKVIVLVSLVITGLVSAQENIQIKDNIKFGIKGGINFTDARGDITRPDIILGDLPLARFHIGGFVAIKLTDKISIQPELLYSGKGFASGVVDVNKWKDKDGNDHEEFNIVKARNQLNYLDIPVMFQYHFVKRVSIDLGPQVSFLVSSTQRIIPLRDKDLDGINAVDFSLNIGMTIDVGRHFLLGVRSNIGLADLLKEEDKKAYNRVFQISAGYRF